MFPAFGFSSVREKLTSSGDHKHSTAKLERISHGQGQRLLNEKKRKHIEGKLSEADGK